MAYYKRKVYTVSAYQWFKDSDSTDVELLESPVKIGELEFLGKIRDTEDVACGICYVSDGDFIVSDQENKKHAIRSDIFLEKFEVME